jgi:phage-related protein
MAELKIKITTDIGQSQGALNKETKSVKSLQDALILAEKNSKAFSETEKRLGQALSRDLAVAFEKTGGGLKGYEAELKVLQKYDTTLRLGVGKTSEVYKNYASTLKYVQKQIEKNKQATEALREAQERSANVQALNRQNANIGFMMLTGDEVGVAKYTLDQYEQSLKEVIAETGVNSKATQEAFEKYAQQKAVVDELTTSQERFVGVQKTSTSAMSDMAEASNKTGLKLLSVAKNILKFQLLMAPITALVRGFRNTLSDAIKIAGEAEQVFNKLETVFDGFGESAKRMATSLASSIGVANSTAASALATVGDLLQAQGMGTGQSLATANDWVRQFQDIIAFKDINMSLEEFAQNFMSGAAGNLRNFRTFGSIVKESAVNAELAKKGLDKLTGSELELAKMTTRAELALQQQANAMGATEREWETALSVNRRLSEAWKAYKENLGDTINSVLKPMKQWWADILDQINKANKAQEEYNKNNKTPGVYDIHNNSKDMASFTKAMNGIIQWNGGQTPLRSVTDVNALDSTQSMLFSQLKETFIEFEATVNDVRTLMGDDLSKAIYDYLDELDRLRTAEAKQRAEIEARQTNITTMVGNADSFMESLAAIAGVGTLNTQDLSWMTYKDYFARGANSEQDAARIISEYLNSGVEEALNKINSADLKSFGDVIDVALGEVSDGDLLKTKAESFRQFYEVLHNYFGKDGDFSQEELDTLDSIKQAYKDANDAAEAYQKRLEAEAGITSHITSAQDVIAESDMRSRYSALGANDSQISIYIKYEKALAELNEQFELLGKETVEINGQLYDQVDATSLLLDARNRELIAIKKEEEEVLKLSDIIAKGIFGANSDKGYAQSFAGAVANSTGGQLVQAGMEGGIIGILTEILVQTETFTEILQSFDPIIHTFSEFIKPILPAVQLIFTVLNELVFSILKPFFPIIKGIAMVVATLAYPIKIVTNVIKNIYTAVHNILERIIHPISGGDRWDYVSLTDGVDEITNIIRDIKNMTFDIKENTDPSNSELLKAYNNMFQKGLITASEYQGLLADINGLNYDRMRTYQGGSWQNNRGGTTIVYNGDMKFEINGTNLSAEQIAEAVTRKQMEQNKTLQYYA